MLQVQYLLRPVFKLAVVLIVSGSFIQCLVAKPSKWGPATPNAPKLTSNAYMLADYNSGYILAEHNKDLKVEPASLTKMMTMYVVDREIQAGKINLDTNILISRKAWQTPGSRMFVEVDSHVPLAELIKGIIIQSGNDASVAVAEHIAGSEAAFADMMNAYAAMLGMENSNFVNATGLPNKNHYSTAYDMFLLGRAIIKEFPDRYHLYAQKEFTYQGIRQINRNRLLWQNQYVDGMKTGLTDTAGHCIVASGIKENMRLIGVVLGAKSDEVRSQDTNKLMNWGFRFFETKQLYQSSQSLQAMRIWHGQSKKLNIGFSEDIYVTIPQGIDSKMNAFLKMPKIIKAPIQKGDVIGTYQVKLKDNLLYEYPVIALETVPRANILGRVTDSIHLAFDSLLDKFDVS